jgi:DNA-binding response OmpR family regulator
MTANRILYVEDEPNLGRIVKESLEMRGFEVRMEADGAAVIQAFTSFQPHIILMDVMLPNKDGFTLASEIRVLDTKTPILFLTAKTQTEDILKGFALGGQDYIKKPFSVEELIARVNNLLLLTSQQSANQDPSKGIQIGAMEYFPLRYELKWEGGQRYLSFRENELLKMLSEPLHEIIQRKDILMKIWGDDSYFNSRNLDVYITKLRDYLKPDSSLRIMTIKGVGYQILLDAS